MNTFLLGMCIIFFGYLCMMIHIAKHWRDHSLHLSKELEKLTSKKISETKLAQEIATQLALNPYWIDLQFNTEKTDAIGEFLAQKITSNPEDIMEEIK